MTVLGRHIVLAQRLVASDTMKSKEELEKTKFFLKPQINDGRIVLYPDTGSVQCCLVALCVCRTSINFVQTHDHHEKTVPLLKILNL
jgi:hypothetical protein